MIAVFRGRATTALYLEKVSFDPNCLRRFFQRVADRGEVRACYEASGAGYVLQRWLPACGDACDLIAPSLIPSKAGDRRSTTGVTPSSTRGSTAPVSSRRSTSRPRQRKACAISCAVAKPSNARS